MGALPKQLDYEDSPDKVSLVEALFQNVSWLPMFFVRPGCVLGQAPSDLEFLNDLLDDDQLILSPGVLKGSDDLHQDLLNRQVRSMSVPAQHSKPKIIAEMYVDA